MKSRWIDVARNVLGRTYNGVEQRPIAFAVFEALTQRVRNLRQIRKQYGSVKRKPA